MTVRYYGIRHHGPGCARALEAALAAQQPDIVLLEGPVEGEALIALAVDEGMQPPVAMLVYPTESPQDGVFYPFAEFSPEWRAIRHAHTRQVPLWFIDLPATHGFAQRLAEREAETLAVEQDAALEESLPELPPDTAAEAPEASDPVASQLQWRMDPIGELSRAAGYADNELWWEIQVEQRRDASELFAAIAEAMQALRDDMASVEAAALQDEADRNQPGEATREARREAHMRSRIREAQKAGYQNIAVVCGAWHVPALTRAAKLKDDQTLLKGLPKTKVAACWVPWSADRLAYSSGYGAGIESPGWYQHLWEHQEHAGMRWVALAARLLRDEGIDVSSASVIEAVRLANALAAVRELPLPGLAEQREAMLSVLCHGDPTPLALVRRQLEIGDRIGAVPAGAAAAPLQRDLEAQQKRLRLKPSTEIKPLDLDLREEGGRERSVLFHRLTILGMHWGRLMRDANRTGTFRERWELQWRPELAVDLIAASRYGNTIESAAAQRLRERADAAADLPALTALLDSSILAVLPEATAALLKRVQDQAAVAADLNHLMEALQPLVRVARYGDVRGTDAASVLPIIHGLVERITIGLAPAASHIDDTAAGELVVRMESVQQSLDTLDLAGLQEAWSACLTHIADCEGLAPRVRGFALRLLFNRQRVDADTLGNCARLMLGAAVGPSDSTSWLTGLLRGNGLLLLHQDALWVAMDTWVQGLGHELFLERLPLLRRAFADFSQSERRQMGSKVKHLASPAAQAAAAASEPLDHTRAQQVLPVLSLILGQSG